MLSPPQKEGPRLRTGTEARVIAMASRSDLRDVGSLETFGTLRDLELHALALLQ
jgi:hypothetical protein